MERREFTPFGKAIKHALIDLNRPQSWLIQRVREETGLYCDSSYMYKIQTGQLSTPSIVGAVCEILGLEAYKEGGHDG